MCDMCKAGETRPLQVYVLVRSLRNESSDFDGGGRCMTRVIRVEKTVRCTVNRLEGVGRDIS